MASLALWAGDLAAQEPPADASVKAADISKRIQSPAKPAPLVAEPEQIADCHRKLDDLIGAQRNPEYKEPIAESFKEIEVEIPKLAERFVALEEDPSIPGDIGEDVRATCQARIPGFGPAYDLASKKCRGEVPSLRYLDAGADR